MYLAALADELHQASARPSLEIGSKSYRFGLAFLLLGYIRIQCAEYIFFSLA